MPTTKPAASVTALIVDKIDHLENNLTQRIGDLQDNLGTRITELSGRVQTQNGRVGKLELAHQKIEDCLHQRRGGGVTRKQVAWLGGGGIISGALVLELLKYLGDFLHKAGFLG